MFRQIARTVQLALLAVAATFLLAAAPAGAVTPTASVGYYHTCVLEGSGTVKCVGANWSGQSTGSIVSQTVQPTAVDLGASAIDVTAGGDFSCAVLEGGTVKCWGDGLYGALGNGDDSNSVTPVTVDLGAAAVAAEANYYSTCALMQDGSVKCWGRGIEGGIGNGSLSNQWTPVNADLSGHQAISLSADYEATCVVVEDGGVWCWGNNNMSNIANPGDLTISTPTEIDLGAPAQAVSISYDHTCALMAGGVVKCWGNNAYGQLGDGTTIDAPLSSPVTVDLGEPATKVAVGWYHSCAQLQSGAAKCWGGNQYGQVSPDQLTAQSESPIDYDAGGSMREIFAGDGATCATLTTGAFVCSGYYVSYYMDPNPIDEDHFGPLLLSGIDMSPPAPPAPSTIAGEIAKPSWKVTRKGTGITASATLSVTGSGMDAERCVGALQVSVPANSSGSGGGTGKVRSAPTFALSFADGKCTAKAKRTIPLRVAKKGVRLKVYLKNAPLMTAASVTTTTKLPKS